MIGIIALAMAVFIPRSGGSTTESVAQIVQTTTTSAVEPTVTAPPTTAKPASTTTRPSSPPVTSPTARVVDDVLRGRNLQGRYSYDVTFPKLQRMTDGAAQESANATILAGVTATTDEFIDQAKVALPSPTDASAISTFTGKYVVFLVTNDVVSLRVTMDWFIAGAAHPSTILQSYVFDLATGKRLALADLFVPGSDYLQVLSNASRAQLKARPGADPDWVERGTTPKVENFTVWNLNEQRELVITFPSYQVGPGSDGTPVVIIPLSTLAPVRDPAGLLGRRP